MSEARTDLAVTSASIVKPHPPAPRLAPGASAATVEVRVDSKVDRDLGGFAASLAIGAACSRRVLAAHPVIKYLNDGAYLVGRCRRPRRRRRWRRSAG